MKRVVLVTGAVFLIVGVLGVGPAAATPGSPHDPRVPSGVGDGRVIVLRPVRADLVDRGVVQRVVSLAGGPINLGALAEAIGDEAWISHDDGLLTLKAAVVQRPGTILDITRQNVQLVDSTTDPASITGSGATLVVDDSTVSGVSIDGAAQPSSHRGVIDYRSSSHVRLDGSTVTHLGRVGPAVAAVRVTAASTLSVVRSSLIGNTVGLAAGTGSRLTTSQITEVGNGTGISVGSAVTADISSTTISDGGVGIRSSAASVLTIADLAVGSNRGAGVSVRDTGVVTMTGVRSRQDGGTGVAVTGGSSAVLEQVSSTADGGAGVRITGVAATVLGSIVATGDRGAGVRVADGGSAVLDKVTSTSNTGAGVMVAGTGEVIFRHVRSASNGGTGAHLAGGSDLRLFDVTAVGNHRPGLVLQAIPRTTVVTRVVTQSNLAGGVVVSGSPGVRLAGLVSSGDAGTGIVVVDSPDAVLTRAVVSGTADGIVVRRSPAVVISAPTVSSVRRGLWVGPGSPGTLVEGGTVHGAVIAVSISSNGVHVDRIAVGAARTGLLVGAVGGAVLADDTVSGAGTGIQLARGSRNTSVRRVHVTQTGGVGVVVTGRGAVLDEVVVDGATTGLLLHGSTTVFASTVTGALEAVRVGSGTTATLTADRLDAAGVGIRALDGSHVTVAGTHVHAPFGTRGHVRLLGSGNDLPALPLHWLGLFGLLAVAVAVTLELLRRLREHGQPDLGGAPLHIRNAR